MINFNAIILKTYPLKKRSLAPRESSGNKNFSNPSGIIKNLLTNMQPRSNSIFSHIRNYGHDAIKYANLLSDDYKKLANTKQNLTFNMRCKKNNLIPKSLISKPPIRTPEGYRIAKRTALHYLKEFISNLHYKIKTFKRNINENTNRINSILPEDLVEKLIEELNSKYNTVKNLKKTQLIEKYNKLSNSSTSNTNSRNLVINISERNLTTDENNVLSKGLNFATTHNDTDKLQFLASLEPVICELKDVSSDQKNDLRQKVTTALKNSNRKSNLTSYEKNAIKSLKEDNSIIIISADKEKATVVINKEDYNSKITTHLNDQNTYLKLTQILQNTARTGNHNPNNSLQTN